MVLSKEISFKPLPFLFLVSAQGTLSGFRMKRPFRASCGGPQRRHFRLHNKKRTMNRFLLCASIATPLPSTQRSASRFLMIHLASGCSLKGEFCRTAVIDKARGGARALARGILNFRRVAEIDINFSENSGSFGVLSWLQAAAKSDANLSKNMRKTLVYAVLFECAGRRPGPVDPRNWVFQIRSRFQF